MCTLHVSLGAIAVFVMLHDRQAKRGRPKKLFDQSQRADSRIGIERAWNSFMLQRLYNSTKVWNALCLPRTETSCSENTIPLLEHNGNERKWNYHSGQFQTHGGGGKECKGNYGISFHILVKKQFYINFSNTKCYWRLQHRHPQPRLILFECLHNTSQELLQQAE